VIDTVFGIKVKNQVYVLIGNRPIIGRLLDADYLPEMPIIGRPIIGHCLIGASLLINSLLTYLPEGINFSVHVKLSYHIVS